MNPRGFTLLEVLVALVVLALSLTALVRLSGLEARALADLRERTVAHWVAANVLEETRLAEDWPATGRRSGSARMGGRDWRWELVVQDTEEPAIRRLDVTVRLAEGGRGGAVLSGFVGRR
ncbi:MAG TPA: type II secretion system minor pseudopilin GspI [Xanthomonadaceae bacterium]|nr:type II secretion system minor pseudopilin GspI [Xanthomonadaceae bacterium]